MFFAPPELSGLVVIALGGSCLLKLAYNRVDLDFKEVVEQLTLLTTPHSAKQQQQTIILKRKGEKFCCGLGTSDYGTVIQPGDPCW